MRHEVGRWVLDGRVGSAADWLVEQLGSAEDRQSRASNVVRAENLTDALFEIDTDRFGPGSVFRAAQLPRMLWVPSALLARCVRYVVDGESDNDLVETLLRPETIAVSADELASSRGLRDHMRVVSYIVNDPTCTTLELDEVQSMVEKFRRCSLVPRFCSRADDIDFVHDNITGANSEDLPSFTDFVRFQSLGKDDPDFMRGCFDRQKLLADELHERGLYIRDDSSLCNAYILHGKYIGPKFPDGEFDEAEMVAEIMVEMEFLFQRTSYKGMMSACGDSETAKLAALHEFRSLKGQPASELPTRLRAIADGGMEKEMLEAWQDVQDYKDAQDTRFSARYCDSNEDSDEDSRSF
jgi:hypothetical protein